jgi:rRNA maturation RNase YbeY
MRVFIHGILHLCGYDHEKSNKKAEEMEAKEEKYFNEI